VVCVCGVCGVCGVVWCGVVWCVVVCGDTVKNQLNICNNAKYEKSLKNAMCLVAYFAFCKKKKSVFEKSNLFTLPQMCNKYKSDFPL
jgi:hypothetical protein